MRYRIHRFLRKLYMRLIRKSCDTCCHYDGRYGEDECFRCERTIRAVEYDKRRTGK